LSLSDEWLLQHEVLEKTNESLELALLEKADLSNDIVINIHVVIVYLDTNNFIFLLSIFLNLIFLFF